MSAQHVETCTVVIAPQERGWAVHTDYSGGQWDGFRTSYYCRWLWQARAEQRRQMRHTRPAHRTATHDDEGTGR